MQSIKKLIKEYLHEELYEADCILRSDPARNFTKVADNLRGVCGITVVTIDSPAKKVGPGTERSYLKVKFFQIEPTMKQQIERMGLDARKIDGVFSFIPIRWNKVVNRIYRPEKRGQSE